MVDYQLCARHNDLPDGELCDYCKWDIASRAAPWDGLPSIPEFRSETLQKSLDRERESDAVLSI
jgi:hypothetical protein